MRTCSGLRGNKETSSFLGLNSDASVRRYKGPNRPYVPEAQRAYMLALYPFVDLVVVFEEDTPIGLIEAIRPDVLVKGGDYTPETIVGRELVESYGGKVVVYPRMDGLSTTALVRRNRRSIEVVEGCEDLAGISVGFRSARLSLPKSAESTSFRGAKGDNVARETSGRRTLRGFTFRGLRTSTSPVRRDRELESSRAKGDTARFPHREPHQSRGTFRRCFPVHAGSRTHWRPHEQNVNHQKNPVTKNGLKRIFFL